MTKRYYPEESNIISSVDDIGAITNLERINGESLQDYKKRILESNHRLANSTYEGLINGISRELGLERKKVIEIDLNPILLNSLDSGMISVSGKVISLDYRKNGIIDGVQVIATGDTITINDLDIQENFLKNLSIVIGTETYLILSNKDNKIKIKGDISSVVGQAYSIEPKWEEGIFSRNILRIGGRCYSILSNSQDKIELEATPSLKIGTKIDMVPSRPRIQVTASRILLYKDYANSQNFQLEKEIELRKEEKNHREIVEEINQSTYFRAIDLVDPRLDSYSSRTLKQDDSLKKAYQEIIGGSKYSKLKHKEIIRSTVEFSETNIFKNEEYEPDLLGFGDYWIDYSGGYVRSNGVPSGNGTISYSYSSIPITLDSTEAGVFFLGDPEAMRFLFNSREKILYTDIRQKEVPSQPTGYMIESVSELLNVKKEYWGK